MFGLSAIASVLDSIDSAAKETLEEPKQSATVIRARRKVEYPSTSIDQDVEYRNIDHGLPLVKYDDESNHSSIKDQIISPASPSQHSRTSSNADICDVSSSGIDKLQATKSALPFNLSSTGLSVGSAKKPILSKDDDTDNDLKQLVRKKAKEIEALNEECIHLESQINSLKQEVAEAWDHYKQAQEKSAVRESELLDEISLIQKSKSTDKQQAVLHISKAQEDISLLTKQLQTSTEEKQVLKLKIEEYESMSGKWEEKITKLKEELQEARMSTIQGAQIIREDLRIAQAQNEQLRNDHANIIRQMQVRQQELEHENQELMKSINDNQRELARLKNSQGSSQSVPDKSYNMDDYVVLQTELFGMAKQYEKEHELLVEKDRDFRILEREYKALLINYEDEKKNSQHLSIRFNDVTQQLQSLKQVADNTDKSQMKSDKQVEYETSILDLKKQTESLSQLLLKRQATVLELQAERSSLKSRVADLQSRCTTLEQQMAKVRDLEDGTFDFEDDADISFSGKVGSAIRKRANDRSDSMQTRGTNRVLNDLEKIGVRPGAGMTKAVTVIDSWTLFTGRVLRHHALLRLGFVLYLLILHLWVLFILIIHTHTLEDLAPSTNPKDQLLN